LSVARSSILVGILLLVGIAGLVFFVSIAGRKGMGGNDTYLVHMTFDDASGLAKRSRIVVAGIDIGKLEKIELVHRKALVTIRVNKENALYEDASVLKRSESLLGDSLLDIDPGTEGKPRIADGGEIKNVRTANGMDQVMATAQRVANNTERITGTLADSIGTDQGKQDIQQILKQLTETSIQVNRATTESTQQLARILGHLEKLTGQISQMAPDQEKQIVQILANVKEITEQTKLAVAAVNAVVDKQGGNVDSAMKQVHDSLDRLDKTLASAQEVVGGVERGEGSVGMLLRDKELAAQVKHTAQAATEYVDRLTGLKLQVQERSEAHLQPRGGGKFAYPTIHTFGAKLIPAKSTRFVGFDIVSDSRGQVQHQIQVINDQPLLTDTWTEAMRYNAYLGQHWGPATFRIGLIESTGGVGADVDLIPEVLALHADAFDFVPVNQSPFPRVRVSGQYTFLNNFDLYVGGDDLMNGAAKNYDAHGILTGGGRSVFAGAGFHLTDDDLKAILSSTGIPKM
jgi:phospholipid/cholesterol/gamma-HCH transport system substrate-binding protein